MQQINISLEDWEEQMIDELCNKYNLSDKIVMDIGISFLYNELMASMNGKKSLLDAIHTPVDVGVSMESEE